MNAVIYARYSSDSQREESIEGQLRECREYAERNNMTIVGTYIDRALSAKTADRPEFQHMIKDSAKELFEIVLVWKLDRFSRDRYDSAHYKHILKKNGVKVISAKEHISEGPEGIILEAMLEGYAEFYSAELSEKIHRGQKENALKGKNNGGGVPLGYLLDKKAQKLVIDPTTAPLVVEVFEKYADGKSVRSIVEDFNARGLKTKRGQPFNINSFSSLLKNRKYIGEYRYQDVVIEGGVPAIVPEDLFNRVQERMEKNRHAPAMAKAKEDYLLTTKLFCGKCERMMVGESGKSHTGAMHYYYKCSGAKRLKDCDKKAVRKDWIERVVVRLTIQRVMDEEKISRLIDAILVMQEQEDTTTPALRSQLAETESAIGNILKAIEQGIFTPSTKQRLDELETRKEEILVNIQTAELQKPKLTREQMTAWFEQFRHGDPANRGFQKRLIDTFVNAVYVFDDKLVLTYNYQHGTQTISLEEIESALSSDFDGATPPKQKPPIGWLLFWWSCTFAAQKWSPAGGRLNASGGTRKGSPLTLPLPCDVQIVQITRPMNNCKKNRGNTVFPRFWRIYSGSGGSDLGGLRRQGHGKGELRDELGGVLVLGRALQIGVAHGAQRRQAAGRGVLNQLARHGGQVLIRPVMVDAQGAGGGQLRDVLATGGRRHRHAEGHVRRSADGVLDEVHPAGDVRAVEPQGLQRRVAQQDGPLRHGIAAIGAAVHRLRRHGQLADLRGIGPGALVELLNVAVQRVAHLLQAADQRHEVGGGPEILPYLVQRQTEILQIADIAQLGEGVDAVIAVAAVAPAHVRLDEAPLLVVQEDAAGHAQRPGRLADGQQISLIFHGAFLQKSKKGGCIVH